MSDWQRLCAAVDLPAGAAFGGEVAGIPVAAFNVNGRFYALEDRCSHERVRLSAGPVAGDVVFCPRHGSRFCLATGLALSPPASEAVNTWEVRVADDWVWVRPR